MTKAPSSLSPQNQFARLEPRMLAGDRTVMLDGHLQHFPPSDNVLPFLLKKSSSTTDHAIADSHKNQTSVSVQRKSIHAMCLVSHDYKRFLQPRSSNHVAPTPKSTSVSFSARSRMSSCVDPSHQEYPTLKTRLVNQSNYH